VALLGIRHPGCDRGPQHGQLGRRRTLLVPA